MMDRTTDRDKAKELVKGTALNELYWFLGRYCGPSNYYLSMKQFGYLLPEDVVLDEINNREAEKFLLGGE